MGLKIDRFAGLACLMVLLLAPGVLEAQVGEVQGRVRDDEGSAVNGAQVRLIRAGTLMRLVASDPLGFFRMADVLPGAYTLGFGGLGDAEMSQPLTVRPGDLLHGDVNGLLTIPKQIAERVEGVYQKAVKRLEHHAK